VKLFSKNEDKTDRGDDGGNKRSPSTQIGDAFEKVGQIASPSSAIDLPEKKAPTEKMHSHKEICRPKSVRACHRPKECLPALLASKSKSVINAKRPERLKIENPETTGDKRGPKTGRKTATAASKAKRWRFFLRGRQRR